MTSSQAESIRPRWFWFAVGGIAAAVVAIVIVGAVWVAGAAREAAATDAYGAATGGPPAGAAVSGPPTPREDGLPAGTTLGVTALVVRDLSAVTAYYRDALGLDVLEQTDAVAVLGRDVPLLRLHAADATAPSPSDAGLYHTALLFADEPTLAQTLARVAQNAPESYQGSADHRVSLAFYLADPEGNGVELYVDRPRDEWTWIDGQVQMGSEPLDPNAFLQEHLGDAAGGSATIGHMHLKVGDLAEARAFYADTLGFDVVAESDGALFYSADGYHHHIATNTWQSAGAGPRSSPLGLGFVTVTLPDRAAVDAVTGRLAEAGHAVDTIDGGVSTSDPWGNLVRFVVGT